MNSIDKLAERFRDFPGIGPRQSKRFVYFLLSRNRAYLEELSRLILEVKKEVHVCSSCYRFFAKNGGGSLCPICGSDARDKSQLLLVEKDVDLENIEKTKIYTGRYFVMGGTIPILEKNPEERVRLRELSAKIQKEAKNDLREIIIAFSINAEGENTTMLTEQTIRPFIQEFNLKISHLGRGLSTGSELEYVDGETLKGAFQNRF
jgi:recombination protein RecR